MRLIANIFLLLLIASMPIAAQEFEYVDYYEESFNDCTDDLFCGHYAYLGPQFYHVKRIRAGGTKQTGYLFGFQTGYEKITPFSLYWGAEITFATGTLKGASGSGTTLESQLTDIESEVRLGYTLTYCDSSYRPTFIPFVGIGYFDQKNKFRAPSLVEFHFQDNFTYMVAGFFANVLVTEQICLGTLFKAKFMWDGKDTVSNDPDFPNTDIIIGEKTQYSVDFPITYFTCFDLGYLTFTIDPFYEYRHYGGRESFPFDFIETKFYDVGAKLLLGLFF